MASEGNAKSAFGYPRVRDYVLPIWLFLGNFLGAKELSPFCTFNSDSALSFFSKLNIYFNFILLYL